MKTQSEKKTKLGNARENASENTRGNVSDHITI